MGVRAAATEDAYRFVTRLSLAVAAGSEPFDRSAWFTADGQVRHLEWAAWADTLVVAPATADAISSAASGRADDVVSALVISGIPKVLWLPAMNTAMWSHPAVRRNVERLEADGHTLLGPVIGPLAARGEGAGLGRMVEPDAVPAAVEALFQERDFEGRKVLVSAGPTREYLDPVRFLSNPSSGKMGYAVAEAARARGASVTLVSGPSALDVPVGVERIWVESAGQMLGALIGPCADADLLVMTAAVADWRAAEVATEKIAKFDERQALELVRTPDILMALVEYRRDQVVVGFSMETDKGVERAAEKARRKRLDFVCLNYPATEDSAFGGDFNRVTVVTSSGEVEELPRLRKRELADSILDRVLPRLRPVQS